MISTFEEFLESIEEGFAYAVKAELADAIKDIDKADLFEGILPYEAILIIKKNTLVSLLRKYMLHMRYVAHDKSFTIDERREIVQIYFDVTEILLYTRDKFGYLIADDYVHEDIVLDDLYPFEYSSPWYHGTGTMWERLAFSGDYHEPDMELFCLSKNAQEKLKSERILAMEKAKREYLKNSPSINITWEIVQANPQ